MDPRYAFSGIQPIAVDARGRLHVAYIAFVEPYSDETVGKPRRVRGLRPGGKSEFRLAIRVRGPIAGKRVLAVLDPGRRRDDLDRPNDAAAIGIDG